MRKWLWYILIFLWAGISSPCSAATYSIDSWNSTNPLYYNSFTTNSDLNFTTDITDSTANLTVTKINADGSTVIVYNKDVDTSAKYHDISVTEKAGSKVTYQAKFGNTLYEQTTIDFSEGQ